MEGRRKDILTKLANSEITIEEANYQLKELDSQYKLVNVNTGYLSGYMFSETIERISPFVEETLILHLRSLESISYQELKELILQNIKDSYLKELANLGYPDLSNEHMVSLVMHGIDGTYIRDLQSVGYEGIDISLIIKMHIHQVNKEYIEALANLNYENLTPNQLVKMQIHQVDPEWERHK